MYCSASATDWMKSSCLMLAMAGSGLGETGKFYRDESSNRGSGHDRDRFIRKQKHRGHVRSYGRGLFQLVPASIGAFEFRLQRSQRLVLRSHAGGALLVELRRMQFGRCLGDAGFK